MTVANQPGGAAQGSPLGGSYVRACALADVPDEGALGVEVEGTPVAIIRAGGEIFALLDVCSHEEVPLSEGDIYDHTVECWLHGSCFDLRTGEPTGPPATKPVPTYPVQTHGDDVYVSLSQEN
jgi:3-phenylpropionate/trans-cinnamate dioxygenase ferredoxin component